MANPPKTSPKEALEYICTNIDTVLSGSVASEDECDFLQVLHRVAKAAIPVAKLEHEAVELLDKLLNETASAMGRVSDETFGKAESIITRLEALKCNPQK